MSQVIIEAQVRESCGKGSSHQARKAGHIPAVYYGKGEKNLHLTISPDALEKAVAGDSGMNTLIELKVQGGGAYKVLLKDYQAHPIKRNFIHADFIHVDLTQKMEVSVPVHLVGKPIGLKEGGILEQITRELVVLCLPTSIPKQIDVDVSELKVGQNLHLHDIKLPEGVSASGKLDLTLAAVIAPKEEAEATPAEGATMAEPEVLTAKKEAAPADEKSKEGGDKAKK